MALNTKQHVPPFDPQHLEAICRIVADTDTGLTGSEIGHLLQDSRIPDIDPAMTKWKRLFNAFVGFQNKHQAGNHIVLFIQKAMSPASYTERPDVFKARRDGLNRVLSLCGMTVGEDGKVKRAAKAKSLSEALQRANRLKAALEQRNVHPDVLTYCNAEALEENYFHAVVEAMKSIAAKIKGLSGLDGDGAELVDRAFSLGKNKTPVLAISSLDSETLEGEQRGFVNLLKGLYGTIRNPLSHEARIEWDMDEQDALDIMTTISLIHRKLDKAYRYASQQ